MQVIITQSPAESFQTAADIILEQVRAKPNAALGLSTGSTSEGVYEQLVKSSKERGADFSQVRAVMACEYRGLRADNPHSFASGLQRWLFSQVNFRKENLTLPAGTSDEQDAVRDFQEQLRELGPLDFQLLGVGASGHIGFNEPDESLDVGVHIQPLHKDTIAANARLFKREKDVPQSAIAMGIGDILSARKILLVAAGPKATPMRALLGDPFVCTQVPVTFLKLHSDVTVVVDKDLAAAAKWQG